MQPIFQSMELDEVKDLTICAAGTSGRREGRILPRQEWPLRFNPIIAYVGRAQFGHRVRQHCLSAIDRLRANSRDRGPKSFVAIGKPGRRRADRFSAFLNGVAEIATTLPPREC